MKSNHNQLLASRLTFPDSGSQDPLKANLNQFEQDQVVWNVYIEFRNTNKNEQENQHNLFCI